jgi:hypothetical protein
VCVFSRLLDPKSVVIEGPPLVSRQGFAQPHYLRGLTGGMVERLRKAAR